MISLISASLITFFLPCVPLLLYLLSFFLPSSFPTPFNLEQRKIPVELRYYNVFVTHIIRPFKNCLTAPGFRKFNIEPFSAIAERIVGHAQHMNVVSYKSRPTLQGHACISFQQTGRYRHLFL